MPFRGGGFLSQIRKHGGNLKEASELYNISEERLIDFSANINPLGPPPLVYQVIIDNLTKIAQYPDSRNQETKITLSKHLGIDKNYLILGNGASELIFLIVNTIRPPKVWIPAPTFSEYELASRAGGANIIYLPLQGDRFNFFSVDKLQEMKKNDILFICNPNNPTGQLYDSQLIQQIIDITIDKEAFLVIDESFLDFLPNKHLITYMEKTKKYNKLIILYSLTKFFAIPGLRLGVAIANPQLIERFDQGRDPWNVNVFAQLAGKVALEDMDYIANTLRFFEHEKKYLYTRLKEIEGIMPFEPAANYIFIKLDEPHEATDICNQLANHGLLVRNCNSYPFLGEKFIRVAVKKREDNIVLIELLKKALKK